MALVHYTVPLPHTHTLYNLPPGTTLVLVVQYPRHSHLY